MIKNSENSQACAQESISAKGGLYWTYRYSDKQCWVKSSDAGRTSENGLVSGTRACAFPQLTSVGVIAFQQSKEQPAKLCGDSDHSTFCTVEKAPFPWVALVLGSKAHVDRVEIKFRENCCGEKLRNIEVRVTDTLPTTGTPRLDASKCVISAFFRGGALPRWHIG